MAWGIGRRGSAAKRYSFCGVRHKDPESGGTVSCLQIYLLTLCLELCLKNSCNAFKSYTGKGGAMKKLGRESDSEGQSFFLRCSFPE